MPNFYTVVIRQKTSQDTFGKLEFDKFVLEFRGAHLELTAFDTFRDIMEGFLQLKLERYPGGKVHSQDKHSYQGHFVLAKQYLVGKGFDSSADWILEPDLYVPNGPKPQTSMYVSYRLRQQKSELMKVEELFNPSPPG